MEEKLKDICYTIAKINGWPIRPECWAVDFDPEPSFTIEDGKIKLSYNQIVGGR